MKKLALVICLLVASLGARAQFEQGKWIINPSLTGLNFSYSTVRRHSLVLVPKPVLSLQKVLL